MRILVLLLCGGLALAAPVPSSTDRAPTAAGSEQRPPPTAQSPAVRRPSLAAVDSVDDLILLEKSSRSLPPVQASPDESTITRIVARYLERSHYLLQRLDDSVSSRFLDRYLDSLDNLRLHFLESDVQDFARYRTRLDELTRRGDTSPAREIFDRFIQRVEQRVLFVGELLKTEKFEFNGTNRYHLDRRHAPRPKDFDEARQLWRQHLRYEVLQEKLNQKKEQASAAKAGETSAPAQPTTPAAGAAEPTANGLSPEIVKTLTRRYARLLRTLREFDGADVFQYYLTALTRVYDPHSDYLGKASLDNFAINMNLSLFGIGAVLQSEDGYCKIKELRPGPAMRSKKIKPGDRIIAVAQGDGDPVDVVDMKLSKAVELIRGPKGSRVRLTIIPADASDPSERREVTLVRDEIKLEDEEAKAKLIEVPSPEGPPVRFGIIDLPSFYASLDLGSRNGRVRPKSTMLDVARLLAKLKDEKVAGVILDLRHNGGGSLEEAIDVTGLFIKKGPVVQVRDSSDRRVVDEASGSMLYEGPLIVLTSRFSASASEILAGALQDYGRALIVGDSSTHGKGTVQSLIQLQPALEREEPDATNNPGALKITVRKFYRATGSSTQLKGVVPDVVLPSVNNYAEVGEASLEDALPWDEILVAPDFEPGNRIAPLLPELRRRSEQRVAEDKDFAYVREDIELYRKFLADKSVSLNEETRRQEKRDNEARVEARKKERKTRQEPPEKVYEITLKQVDLPGLPPPTVATNEVADAAASAAVASADDEDTDPGEDKTPPVDATLKETRRVLLDLIALSQKETGFARKP